ncbi:MAG: TonB-dependent receptor [Acidobacteriota bacterium]|nr:TonB-dependent receptor [Acidobacteriota bacterium]
MSQARLLQSLPESGIVRESGESASDGMCLVEEITRKVNCEMDFSIEREVPQASPTWRKLPWPFQYLLLFIMGVLLAIPALAQSASVSGQVTDPHGAMVRGAKVTLTNETTNVALQSKTNAVGIYSFPFVHPGVYTATVSAEGFKLYRETSLKIETAQALEIDMKLQIGSVKESITVDGSGIQVNTVDATVSTLVDQEFVENLPMNGRSFQRLLTAAPGIVDSPTGGGNQWSINGQRVDENYFTIDGISANAGIATVNALSSGYGGLAANFSALGTTQSMISMDAIDEFRISTSNYSAEYGRAPGGQFTITSRAGTNRWHGSAYDYLRNNAMDANNWFNTYNGCHAVTQNGVVLNSVTAACAPRSVSQQKERQNDFGGTLGGPVRLPWLYNGTDKTFFFFSYENLILQSPNAAQQYFVPSDTMRSEANSVFKPFLNAFPVSHNADLGSTIAADAGFTYIIGGFSVPSRLNSTSLRLDHKVNDKVNVFARYSRSPSSSSGYCQYCYSTLAQWESKTNRTTTGTVGVTTTFSSKISNDLRLGLTQVNSGGIYSGSGYGGATGYGFQDMPGFVQGQWNASIETNGWGPATLEIMDESRKNAQRQGNIVDSTTISQGHHTVKFGVDFRRTSTWQANPGHNEYGNIDSLAMLEDGKVAPYFKVAQYTVDKPQYYNTGLYVQDEWRATSRLNLSLGLRWDIDPAPHDGYGHNPWTFSQVNNLSTMYLVSPGAPLWKTQWAKFAPRLGFAYRLWDNPSSDTVIRGGIGLFYDTGNTAASTAGITGASATNNDYGCYNSSATVPDATCLSWPLAMSNFPSITAASYYPAEVNPNLKSPYTVQWNVAVQQNLGRNQSLTLTYVGNIDQDLMRGRGVNLTDFQTTITPGLSGGCCTYYFTNGSASKYNSLQAQFQRKLSQGLQVLASYTWAHALDNATGNATNYSWAWGTSDYDVRQNLQVAGTYLIPGHHSSGWLSQIVDKWNLDLRLSARTALPENIVATLQSSSISDGEYMMYKPNLVAGQPLYLHSSEFPGGKIINYAAFAKATDASGNPIDGNFPRNGVRAFGIFETDLAVHKDFRVTEGLTFQFRAEAFNLFNHPMFGPMGSTMYYGAPAANGSGFGYASATANTSTTTQENSLYQTGGPRSLQVALKLKF